MNIVDKYILMQGLVLIMVSILIGYFSVEKVLLFVGFILVLASLASMIIYEKGRPEGIDDKK